MTLAEIKQQLQKEEKAIARLRYRYPHLSKMTVAEMLAYLNLTQKSELVAYVEHKKEIGYFYTYTKHLNMSIANIQRILFRDLGSILELTKPE
jgi:hypothetical protein